VTKSIQELKEMTTEEMLEARYTKLTSIGAFSE